MWFYRCPKCSSWVFREHVPVFTESEASSRNDRQAWARLLVEQEHCCSGSVSPRCWQPPWQRPRRDEPSLALGHSSTTSHGATHRPPNPPPPGARHETGCAGVGPCRSEGLQASFCVPGAKGRTSRTVPGVILRALHPSSPACQRSANGRRSLRPDNSFIHLKHLSNSLPDFLLLLLH